MRLLVGCPVYNRAWILPRWHEWIQAGAEELGIVPQYVFVGSPEAKEFGEVVEVVEGDPGGRDWTNDRIQHMVWLRNQLLAEVRSRQPDLFLSLDSDILLHPKAFENMIELIEDYDAVGSRCYLTPRGRIAPNYAQRTVSGGYRRPDTEVYVGKMDVLMAIKLMGPAAYNVDYRFHEQGEDFGWSEACREQGLKLGYDARVCSKHVMSPEWLSHEDKRCGY